MDKDQRDSIFKYCYFILPMEMNIGKYERNE